MTTPSTAGTELLACPFCGGKPETFNTGTSFAVTCTDCDMCTRYMPGKQSAFERWNTRTPPGLSREAWQSIETAPRDGSNALVFDIDVGAVVAYWLNDGWLLVGGKFGAYPTHWQPLPNPPDAILSLKEKE